MAVFVDVALAQTTPLAAKDAGAPTLVSTSAPLSVRCCRPRISARAAAPAPAKAPAPVNMSLRAVATFVPVD